VKRALIIGCGYTGMRLAARLREISISVGGTTRSKARADELEAAGIEPLPGSLSDPKLLRQIRDVSPHLVAYFVPPQLAGEDPLQKVIDATAGASIEAFVYASSTSVYGDRDGDWVDEETVARPQSRLARARLAAERFAIDAARTGLAPTRVCRITGIYGPGRTFGSILESGEYVLIKGRDTWVNRIHVDDLVSGLVAAWQHGVAGRVYNLADNEPHKAHEFAIQAAKLHGFPEPRWIDESEAVARLGELRLRRKLDSKRVRNGRLTQELGVKLAYPTFRTGLPLAVAEEKRTAR
jgi:nucleoside-diphosphate-sugar epimerase